MKKLKFGRFISACLIAVTALFAGCSSDSSSDNSMALLIAAQANSVSLDSVSISRENEESLGATSSIELTAAAKGNNIANVEVAYAWEISEGEDYAVLSANEGSAVTLTGRNATTSEQTVSVRVKATYNGKTVEETIQVSFAAKAETEPEEPTTVEKEISSVVVTGSEKIEADGYATLTAAPAFSATDEEEAEVAYKWEITAADDKEATESIYFTLAESTENTVLLTAKNEEASSHKVTVKVTATYKEKSVEDSITVTAEAKGVVVEDKVTEVKVTAAPEAIDSDGSATLTAAETSTGTPAITYAWEITEGSNYASISQSEDGKSAVLKASNTTTSEQKVTVKVTASDGTNSVEDTAEIILKAGNALQSVSVADASIDAKTENTLTATSVFSKTYDTDERETYKWEIIKADGTDAAASEYITLEDSTSSAAKVIGKNTDSENDHIVIVQVTATYKGESKTATATVTVAKAEAEVVYFTGFAASNLGAADDADAYKTFTASDGTWTVNRAKYQASQTFTADDKTSYTGRVKVNKADKNDDGTFTLKNVKVGSVLRIDGGNTSNDGKVRQASFSGTDKDETTWDSVAGGTFYVTAKSSTVVIKSLTNEFSIYAISVVESAAETTERSSEKTYSAPVVTLADASGNAAESCNQNDVIVAKATVADASIVTTYSDGTQKTSTAVVAADLTWTNATANAADSKTATVDTATAGNVSVSASYTIGSGEEAATYSSEAVMLQVIDTTKAHYNVTFETNGGSSVEVQENIEEGCAAAKPDDPYKIGFLFAGWFSDSGLSSEYDFASAVNANLTLYAKWTEQNPTLDSWNLLSPSADVAALTSKNDSALPSDITEIGASKVLALTLSASGTGVGTTKSGAKNYPVYLYSPDSGLLIKRDALKIEGIKGSVKATIKWRLNGSSNRNLEVTVGNETKTYESGTAKGDKEDVVVTFDGGADGTTLYIGASNELYIKSITIEPDSGEVSSVITFSNALEGGVSVSYTQDSSDTYTFTALPSKSGNYTYAWYLGTTKQDGGESGFTKTLVQGYNSITVVATDSATGIAYTATKTLNVK